MDTNAALIIVALINTIGVVITAVVSWKTHNLTLKVEKATNSLMDQRVATEKELSHIAGVEQGAEAGRVKAAELVVDAAKKVD